MLCVLALFVKPNPRSSFTGKAFAGEVVSLSRSRTVLLYSWIVRRRTGEGPGSRTAFTAFVAGAGTAAFGPVPPLVRSSSPGVCLKTSRIADVPRAGAAEGHRER